MKYKFKTFIVSVLLVFAMLTNWGFACKVDAKTIDEIKKTSGKVASSANTGVNVTRELFRAKLISPENTEKIAGMFVTLADGGIAFDASVAKVEQQFGNTPPQSELETLWAMFDRDTINKYIEILKTLKILGPNSDKYATLIESIKTTVLIVAKLFGKTKQVQARLATA